MTDSDQHFNFIGVIIIDLTPAYQICNKRCLKRCIRPRVDTTEPVCVCASTLVPVLSGSDSSASCPFLTLVHMFLCLSARAWPRYVSGQNIHEREGSHDGRLLVEGYFNA